jgi:hypothetical protein
MSSFAQLGGYLLKEDMERPAGDTVRLSEDRVVGREAEDGRPRRRDAPRHDRREPLQAVLAEGASVQVVASVAVDPFPVQLELRFRQVERGRQLKNVQRHVGHFVRQ